MYVEIMYHFNEQVDFKISSKLIQNMYVEVMYHFNEQVDFKISSKLI